MNHKQKLGYTVLGAVIMLVGLGLGAIVSPPLIAQRNGVFDEIECSKLTVVDKNDKLAIILAANEDENGIVLLNQAGTMSARLSTDKDGSSLGLFNAEGERSIALLGTETGGIVALCDGDGQEGIYLVVNELARFITVLNEEGEEAISLRSLNQVGDNRITVFNTEGESTILLDSSRILGNHIKLYDTGGNISWEAP